MASRGRKSAAPERYRLAPDQLRWRCEPESFEFQSTKEIGECPINIIGQPRALEALRLGLTVRAEGYNVFVSGRVGGGRSTVVRRMLEQFERGEKTPDDVVFVHNFQDSDQPRRLTFPAGRGGEFRLALEELVEGLSRDLPQLFESEPYAKRRATMRDVTASEQKARLKEFEGHVAAQGFALVQVQVGPAIAPQLLPVVAGNPTEMDKLEILVEQGQFKADEFEQIKDRFSKLRTEMETLAKGLRNMDRDLKRKLEELDKSLAKPLVEEAVGELRVAFESPGLEGYLDRLTLDLLEHLDEIRETQETPELPAGLIRRSEPITKSHRYKANVVVDNSETRGRPVIWETAPTYRNLFGTIDAVRNTAGEWGTDHTRIKGGSLLRASGGVLVLDALDVLVEPGVWAALKRTLRTGRVEIQAFDPLHIMAGISLKPEAAPIDVKVLMIGTAQIYGLLYNLDEDFKKVFKVKAEFAVHTPLNQEELWNYACFINKKIGDDDLLPFHRTAVAAVVEEGMRLAGDHHKLTTRFTDIADLVREANFWARENNARMVRAQHVDQAVAKQAYRVDLIEEMLRDLIVEGTVLLDLDGAKVGQVNGLAVLDTGDHVFAHPSRITATTAMGRAGIINIDREARMSGALHTKGMLILTGFLRSRFAQNKPLSLTASLTFEQNYGPIDGDSASSAELYALLSSLAGVPILQGIAVTGSVNQRGEVQPIGGVNQKIEGYFDLCRLKGLTGKQGVMIPARNLPQLMLRKDLLAEARRGRFHVWGISTIEQGLETLTGESAGTPDSKGRYPERSIFGRVDRELTRLAEEGVRFGRPSQSDKPGKS